MSWSISFSGGQTLSMHSLCPHGPTRIYMVFVEETPKYKLLPINSLIAEIPMTKHETLKIDQSNIQYVLLMQCWCHFKYQYFTEYDHFETMPLMLLQDLHFQTFLKFLSHLHSASSQRNLNVWKKIKLANNSEFFFFTAFTEKEEQYTTSTCPRWHFHAAFWVYRSQVECPT